MTTTQVPHRLLTVLLAAVAPLAFTLAAGVWVMTFADELPNPVAIHWGADGRPDGFGSLASSFGLILIVTLLMCALATVIGVLLGRAAATRRIAVFFGMWSGIALPWFVAGTLDAQRGLADAADAPGVGQAMLMSFSIAAVLAAAATALMPGDVRMPATEAVPAEAARLELADSESASWRQGIQLPGFQWIAGAGGLATVVLAMLATVAGVPWAGYWAGIIAFVTALLLLTGRWQAVVDHTGLTVSPLLSWPRTHVPLDEVIQAEAVSVSPLGDFGGWGYRVGRDGAVGIVVRSGEALKVSRTGGRSLMVTVDDAVTGAALLNTLADRARRR